MIWIILGSILGAIFLLALIYMLITGSIFFKIAFLRRKGDEHFAESEDLESKNSPERKWLWSQSIEELTLVSYDNLKLKGYLIENKNSNKLAILVHGYHGRYYSLTIQAKFLYEYGYSLLLINNRCHDTSEGKYFTMGKKETRDLNDWIKLMRNRFPTHEFILMGASMGGHIVMMNEGEETNKEIKAIISDSGYANLKDALKFELRNIKIPLKPIVLPFVNIYLILFKGFSLNNNTKNAGKKANAPLLLLHGTNDSKVEYKDLEINKNNFKDKVEVETKTFEGAEHLEAIHTYKEEYKETVISFLKEHNL